MSDAHDDLFAGLDPDSTSAALASVESRRREQAEYGLEITLSVNDWVGRVKAATMSAHAAARAGSVFAEAEAWTDVAAVAVARLEQLQRMY